jgi:transposase
VPATLASRARLLSVGGGRKTDATDAASVAQVALHHPMLRVVTAEDQTSILRLLAKRRDDLAGERTRILNRLHGLLRDLLPGGAPSNLTANKAAALLRRLRPQTATAACRRQLARELLGDLRRVDARLADNTVQLRDALAATGSTLTQVHGLGVVLAAKILGHVGDVTRFPNQDHFASYTATAPLDASSGNHQRHRLNPGGNRQLNAPCTSSPSAKLAIQDGPPRLPAQAERGQYSRRGPAERSSAAWPTSSTGASWPTNTDHNQPPLDTQRRC